MWTPQTYVSHVLSMENQVLVGNHLQCQRTFDNDKKIGELEVELICCKHFNSPFLKSQVRHYHVEACTNQVPLLYVLVQLLCIIMYCGPPVANGTFYSVAIEIKILDLLVHLPIH